MQQPLTNQGPVEARATTRTSCNRETDASGIATRLLPFVRGHITVLDRYSCLADELRSLCDPSVPDDAELIDFSGRKAVIRAAGRGPLTDQLLGSLALGQWEQVIGDRGVSREIVVGALHGAGDGVMVQVEGRTASIDASGESACKCMTDLDLDHEIGLRCRETISRFDIEMAERVTSA